MTERLAYRVRLSRRARRLWLKVTGRGEVEVVIPRGYDPAAIPGIVERERAWILAALARLERQRQIAPTGPWQPPDQIELPAAGAAWQLTRRATAQPGVRVRQLGADRLELAGRIEEMAACREALDRWLLRQARSLLLPRLAAASRSLALPYRSATVRLQRSRWGSCSANGAISLNGRLLLLPLPLVDYVLLHELCHTRVRNHSPRFWALVARHCPDHSRLRTELRLAGRNLPAWAAQMP